jgi:uncharacterized protein YeaO (DUF488 family)
MFKVASIYALKRLSEQERSAYGLRVLIMRSWPRGITKSDVDLWIPSAAPSAELLAAHCTGRMTWHDFTIIYRTSQIMAKSCRVLTYQSLDQPQVQIHEHRALDHLHILEREQKTVTLLCWEPEAPCHRFLLQELLENPLIEAEMKGVHP